MSEIIAERVLLKKPLPIKKKNISYVTKRLKSLRKSGKRVTTMLGGAKGAAIRKYWGLSDSVDDILDGKSVADVVDSLLGD